MQYLSHKMPEKIWVETRNAFFVNHSVFAAPREAEAILLNQY